MRKDYQQCALTGFERRGPAYVASFDAQITGVQLFYGKTAVLDLFAKFPEGWLADIFQKICLWTSGGIVPFILVADFDRDPLDSDIVWWVSRL